MNANIRTAISRTISVLAILAMLPAGAAGAQAPEPPPPAAPFDAADMPVTDDGVLSALMTPPVGTTFQTGADRLAAMQAWDGGWGWPLIAPTDPAHSPTNTLGPIAMGLQRAAGHTSDPIHTAAISDAAAYLLTKSGNFSPSDGYLALALDENFGGTTYRDFLKANFYDLLAAGSYNRITSPADPNNPYDTAEYVARIRSSRAGTQANMAAWDVGMGLVGAIQTGVDDFNKAIWIQGVKDEINELDGDSYYDVIGLAGAVYGLAEADEHSFDPTSGEHALAGNLMQLGVILAGYQLPSGGWTWNSNYQVPDDGNETIQETAYAILALNRLNWENFLPEMVWGGDFLYATQLASGGWENYPTSGENNEVTGEALWALATVYRGNEIWVCPTGDCGHPEMSFNTIQAAVDAAEWGGLIHVLAGTYPESVTINKNVQLVGAGIGDSIIQAPPTLPAASQQGSAILIINGGDDVEITGFTVTGPGPSSCGSIRYGIFVRDGAHASIHDNTLADIRDNATPLSGCQNGVAIGVGRQAWTTAGVAEIVNNTIVGYQKGAIVVDNTGSFAHIEGNTITGIGTTDITAQNGIQISRGADATIAAGNAVTGNSYYDATDPVWSWGAAGLLLYQPGNVAFTGVSNVSANDANLYNDGAAPIFLDGLVLGGSSAPAGIGMDITNYGTAAIDATSASFTGAVDGFDIEDRVFHALDDNTLGLVTWTDNNVFVTLDSGSIQRGIDAVAPDDSVHVDVGSFAERLDITKPLQLLGSGASFSTGILSVGTTIDATTLGSDTDCGNVIDITALTGDTEIQGFDILTGDYNSGIHFAGGTDPAGHVYVEENHITGTGQSLCAANSYQYGVIGGYEDVRTVAVTGNEISDTYDNSILMELQLGATDIHTNVFNGGFPSIFYMTYDGHDVTPLQKVSDNAFDMSLAEAASGAAGVGVNPSTYYVDTTRRNGKYADFEISGNTFTGIADVSIKAISVGENSLDGATGGFDNLQIFGNTISGTDGKGIQFFGHVTNASVYNNEISGLYQGLKLFSHESAFWPEGNDISCNQVTGASDKLVFWTGATPLVVEFNYWGAALGPDPSKMSANVDYKPWLTTTACGGGAPTLPPFPVETTFSSVSPEPSHRGASVTIEVTVANTVIDGPIPVGTVDVAFPGLDPIPACNDLALNGSGIASCSYVFPNGSSYLLTATFTPTDPEEFLTDSETHSHKVWAPLSDFNDDDKTEPAKFDPATGLASWLDMTSGTWTDVNIGTDASSYVPRSDFDGDGFTDPAKYVSGNLWYMESSTDTMQGIYVGTDFSPSLAGSDFDGDGRTDPAKYITGPGAVWYLKSTTGTWVGKYVGSDAAPFLAASDFDGDGKTDFAKYVPSAGAIWYFESSTGLYKGIYIGSDGTPVAGSDFDGDFKSDLTKFVPSANAVWYRRSTDGIWVGVYMGTGPFDYVPAADFDGDNRTDPAKYVPSADAIYYLESSSGIWRSKWLGGRTGGISD